MAFVTKFHVCESCGKEHKVGIPQPGYAGSKYRFKCPETGQDVHTNGPGQGEVKLSHDSLPDGAIEATELP